MKASLSPIVAKQFPTIGDKHTNNNNKKNNNNTKKRGWGQNTHTEIYKVGKRELGKGGGGTDMDIVIQMRNSTVFFQH